MMLQKEEIDKQTEVYKTFPQMYAEYNYIIHSRKLMDYDDQLIYAYKLLESNEELLNYYRSIYRYISVDEAQDTSYIQHCLIQLLVGETGNLFMVGDEDQSIYGFRAAYPQELYEFQNIYDDAQILNIETNYRSGSVIVQLADGFIQKNKQRHPKRMTPDRKDVGDIEDIDFHSRREVAQYLSTIAKEKPVDTAILYRNNESALPIVNLLDKQGIPYRIRGNDTTFFSHPVIRDISAILQLSLNGRNREAFRQIYYKVSAYITKGEAQEATSTYISDNDFFAYLAVNGKEGTKKTKRLWFVSYRLREMREMSALDAIRMIRDKLSYDNYMREKGLDYKKADMYEILASQCGNVGDFLKRMEELETIVSEGSNSDEGIHLSTIHMSKGLEYDTVYLLDSLQGIFPAVTADIQEERRLFYVAVTRAKNHLKFLSVYDGDDQPSSFVTEALGLAPFTRSKVKL